MTPISNAGRKKKESLFLKVHRRAEATHHLWEHRHAHPSLRACRALLIGTSANIQQPGPPGSPSVALWSAVLHVWWFHPGNPHLASKWKNSLLCMVTACMAESKAAMAAGFLYSRLKCHNYSPPRGKGKTLDHVCCGGRSRELPFSVFLRNGYFRAVISCTFSLSCFIKTPHLCFPASSLSKPIFHS